MKCSSAKQILVRHLFRYASCSVFSFNQMQRCSTNSIVFKLKPSDWLKIYGVRGLHSAGLASNFHFLTNSCISPCRPKVNPKGTINASSHTTYISQSIPDTEYSHCEIDTLTLEWATTGTCLNLEETIFINKTIVFSKCVCLS